MTLRQLLLAGAGALGLAGAAPAAQPAGRAIAPEDFRFTVSGTVGEAPERFGLLSAELPASTWSPCIAEVLQHEGGFVNHPRDPGGATNRGITLAVLAEWRGRPVTVAEVRALTEVEAREIYRARYWAPIQGDHLPPGLALALFDFTVNSGGRRAVRTLQQVMGFRAPACDGVLGPATLAAIRRRDALELLDGLCDARLAFMRALPIWDAFGRGWAARVARVRAVGRAMAGAPAPA